MHRRDFISSFSKLSLLTATASLGSRAVTKSRNIAGESLDKAGEQLLSLKKRMHRLEINQKRITKGLLLLTAVSTGIDLSLIL